MKQEMKNREMKQTIASLNGYTIICSTLGTKKTWYLMKNGKIVSPKAHSNLYNQLEKCKDYLGKDQYKVENVKIMRNEMPLAPGFGGILGNVDKIGKGIGIIRQGAGVIKIGQSILDIVNNAPQISNSKSSDKIVDDILEGAKDTTRPIGKAKNFEKDGNMDDAVDDFNSLNPKNVKEIKTQYGDGLHGVLEDGTRISVRPGSGTGGSTLEIKAPGKPLIKVRYGK
ncbi:hypothetical protein [Enterococcus plantarum]|uniref:hypothetical protein n=1 Tax=Enterococcus plantarum TaxID=1077675 RepID=UPI001A8F3EB6|nr:hypothetical protein [Enterococcus plantarum]